MPKDRRSFFEKITGSAPADDLFGNEPTDASEDNELSFEESKNKNFLPNANEEGQLMVDVYQTPDYIIVRSVVAGVEKDDLDVEITQDMVTVRGKREASKETSEDDYFYKELYWGSFSRSVMLPQEVDADNAEANLKNGVLTIKMPKLDREKRQKLKIKSE